MPVPSRLCLWSHVIRFASYSLNSLLHLPKKNNEKKKNFHFHRGTTCLAIQKVQWNFDFSNLRGKQTLVGKNRAKCSFLFHIIKNQGLAFTFWLTSVVFFLPFHVIPDRKIKLKSSNIGQVDSCTSQTKLDLFAMWDKIFRTRNAITIINPHSRKT